MDQQCMMIWLWSCLRVEIGAVSTLVSVAHIESCLQRRTAISVIGAGAGAIGRLEGGTRSVAIGRMAFGGAAKPVEKFCWIWFFFSGNGALDLYSSFFLFFCLDI